MRKTAAVSKNQFESDVKNFIDNNFYVDDGLASLPTSSEAIDLMKRTYEALKKEGNLRLHKIASYCKEVLKAFPENELAKSLTGLDFNGDKLPLQHSLGLSWSLKNDTFTFHVLTDDKPYTRRGILSVVNCLFDPLGFVCPLTIQGKLLLRSFLCDTTNWDEPLPEAQ